MFPFGSIWRLSSVSLELLALEVMINPFLLRRLDLLRERRLSYFGCKVWPNSCDFYSFFICDNDGWSMIERLIGVRGSLLSASGSNFISSRIFAASCPWLSKGNHLVLLFEMHMVFSGIMASPILSLTKRSSSKHSSLRVPFKMSC